jgi:hypothetical protein
VGDAQPAGHKASVSFTSPGLARGLLTLSFHAGSPSALAECPFHSLAPHVLEELRKTSHLLPLFLDQQQCARWSFETARLRALHSDFWLKG